MSYLIHFKAAGKYANIRRHTNAARDESFFSRATLQIQFRDSLRIINAPSPGAAARQLERGPEFGVRGQRGIRREVLPCGASRENLFARFRAETLFAFAHQINTPFDAIPINHNTHNVPIQHFANRSTRQTFRTDMPNARARRNTGKSRVRQKHDSFSVRKIF